MFHKAIEKAEPSDDVKIRVNQLIDSITYSVFMYTTRGLFERDKLIFTAQVTFQVKKQQITIQYMYSTCNNKRNNSVQTVQVLERVYMYMCCTL